MVYESTVDSIETDLDSLNSILHLEDSPLGGKRVHPSLGETMQRSYHTVAKEFRRTYRIRSVSETFSKVCNGR